MRIATRFSTLYRFILFTTLFFTSGMVFADKNIAGSYPKISLSPIVKDMGDVFSGAVLESEFEVKNEGQADLIIRSLNPSCGCTSAVINNPVIKPKEKGLIKFTFNTLGFFGQKEKSLRVYSNDPINSTSVISIRANILEPVVVTPNKLDLGELGSQDELKASFEIRAYDDDNLVVNEVFVKSSFLSASLAPRGAGKYVVEISRSGVFPLGRMRTMIVVKTNNHLRPVVTIPLTMFVRGALTANPREVNFGFLNLANASQESISRIVRLSSVSSASTVRVSSVEKTGRDLDVQLLEDSNGQYVVLTINSLAKGVVRGVVKAITDSTLVEEKTVEIPYFAFVDPDTK